MRSISYDNDYQAILLKLIPSEIIAAYLVLQGVINSAAPMLLAQESTPEQVAVEALRHTHSQCLTLAFACGFLTLLTPVYLYKLYKIRNSMQLVFTTVSLPIWIYSVGGPFECSGLYVPWLASVILILWTLLTPLVALTAQSRAKFAVDGMVRISVDARSIIRDDRTFIMTDPMKQYRGSTARIVSYDASSRFARLDVDNGAFDWAAEWLTPN